MRFDTIVEETLNGLAEEKTLEDIAKKHNVDVKNLENELKKGIKTETKEHTKNDFKTGKKIAMDHLWEDPKYYTKLAEMEKNKD